MSYFIIPWIRYSIRRLFVLLPFIFLQPLTINGNRLLQTLYTREYIDSFLVEPTKFCPIPVSSSNYWKRTVGYWTRNSYTNNGRGYLGKKWTPIPTKVFKEFSITGNRGNYEALSFNLRRQMACMVMAEIMQDSSLFINDIIAGLHYFKNETWWGVPAHYPLPIPDSNIQEVDLFNAETANLLVWTCYMLEQRIEPIDNSICDEIRAEIKRRILVPARTINYTWKTHSWNHNPWTCANWISCILFCEKDRQQQVDDICQVLKCLDVFIDGYSEDGGCDEGVNYWDRATGSLFECMHLLDLASNHKISLPLTPKIKSMASYIYKMYIGQGKYVNFAASNPNTLPNINILYPLGKTLQDTIMMKHAAFIAQEHEFIKHPWKLFNQNDNYPSISRELCFLPFMPEFVKEKALEAHISSAWLPNTEIFTANNSAGLFIAAKGGHNDESHNHNDIGNFIIYANNQPLFIDLGKDSYSAKTFNQERYTLMNTRSAYHNVPIINGKEQRAGRLFMSKNAMSKKNSGVKLFSLDIAKSYAPDAFIRNWERQFRIDDQSITITERFRIDRFISPSIIVLMTPHFPRQDNKGMLVFNLPNGKYALNYSPNQLLPEIETIDISQTAMQSSWGKTIYRIKMKILQSSKNNKISYTIKRYN